MTIEQLIGQQTVWQRLLSAVENDRVPSAYLFHGPVGAGKEGFAIRFSSLLNCRDPKNVPCGNCPSCAKFRGLQHPNLLLVVPLPTNKKITRKDPPLKAISRETLTLLSGLTVRKGSEPYLKIDLPKANTILLNSVRDIRKKIYLKASEAGRKMILIFDAHKLMTQQGESANALLKIVEEPPQNTSFILVTDFPQRLSETIRSRCQEVYFPPVPEKELMDYLTAELDKESSEARLIAHLSQGNIRVMMTLAQEELSEVERMMKSLVGWTTSATAQDWNNFLKHFASLYRTDTQAFSFHMQLLVHWFRDAMLIQKLNGQAELILENSAQELEEFVNKFPSADYAAIVSKLGTCADSLSRNYNPNLVLVNLLLDIQEDLNGKSG